MSTVYRRGNYKNHHALKLLDKAHQQYLFSIQNLVTPSHELYRAKILQTLVAIKLTSPEASQELFSFWSQILFSHYTLLSKIPSQTIVVINCQDTLCRTSFWYTPHHSITTRNATNKIQKKDQEDTIVAVWSASTLSGQT